MCEVIKKLFNEPYEIQNMVLSRWSNMDSLDREMTIEINGKLYSDLPVDIIYLINSLIEEKNNKK